MVSGPPNGTCTELFISSDMFYLEILLEPSGAVKDVKIHHEGKSEQQVSYNQESIFDSMVGHIQFLNYSWMYLKSLLTILNLFPEL